MPAHVLFTAKKNQIKMMKIRGFDVSPDSSLNEAEFKRKYEAIKGNQKSKAEYVNSLSKVYHGNGKTCSIVYMQPPSRSETILLEHVRTFATRIADELAANQSNTAILITKKNLTSDGVGIINAFRGRVQHFTYFQLMFVPTDHILSFKIKPFSVQESEEIVQKENIKSIFMLPHIKVSDPVSKFYGLQPGQLVEIAKTNITGPNIVNFDLNYRVVVPDEV